MRSKIHASRHGNNNESILCLPHRVLSWLSSNAYHEGNVEWRNPTSTTPYTLCEYTFTHKELMGNSLTYLSNIELENPFKFYTEVPRLGGFTIISSSYLPIIVRYKDDILCFFPSVIADVKDGEYGHRRFAIIFGVWNEDTEDYEWGMVEDKHFFHYIGFNSLTAYINTCVWGKAKQQKEFRKYMFYSQRKSCNKCE